MGGQSVQLGVGVDEEEAQNAARKMESKAGRERVADIRSSLIIVFFRRRHNLRIKCCSIKYTLCMSECLAEAELNCFAKHLISHSARERRSIEHFHHRGRGPLGPAPAASRHIRP